MSTSDGMGNGEMKGTGDGGGGGIARSALDAARTAFDSSALKEIGEMYVQRKLFCYVGCQPFIFNRFVKGVTFKVMNGNPELRKAGYAVTSDLIKQYLHSRGLVDLSVNELVCQPAVNAIADELLQRAMDHTIDMAVFVRSLQDRAAKRKTITPVKPNAPISSLTVAALRSRARHVLDRNKLRNWRGGFLALSVGGVPWGPALLARRKPGVTADNAAPGATPDRKLSRPTDDAQPAPWTRFISKMQRVHLLCLLEDPASHEWHPTDPAQPSSSGGGGARLTVAPQSIPSAEPAPTPSSPSHSETVQGGRKRKKPGGAVSSLPPPHMLPAEENKLDGEPGTQGGRKCPVPSNEQSPCTRPGRQDAKRAKKE
mmetsp:Transcript_2307/g.6421  ORF Transcript_2307/g.6421 Transcript_2307/m.6421 type:complete len:370 (-) Transcript_2307:16-1125(-)